MKPTKIKAFIPFALNAALFEWCAKAAQAAPSRTAEVFKNFVAGDPGDHEWTNTGFIGPVEEGRLVHDLDGKARLMMIQFSERKLPASVRDEEVSKRYKAIVEKGDRKLNKKEFAQLREDVESDLLPQAFITRKLIPIFVFNDSIMVATSSPAMAEKVLTHLRRFCEVRKIQFDLGDIEAALETENTLSFTLAEIARNGLFQPCNQYVLKSGSSATFKGEDKRTIRVKERDLLSEEIAKVTTSGSYAVTDLAIVLANGDDDDIAGFTLSDKFIVKGVKLSDVTMTRIGSSADDVEDAHATYWLLAATFSQILDAIAHALNNGEPDDDSDEEL